MKRLTAWEESGIRPTLQIAAGLQAWKQDWATADQNQAGWKPMLRPFACYNRSNAAAKSSSGGRSLISWTSIQRITPCLSIRIKARSEVPSDLNTP